ncbi:MAG: fimbria/pilus outer membrane usher protein [Methylocella sp.]
MIVLGPVAAPWPARAEGPLQLEVLLNGKPIGLIGAFLQDAKGGLSAKRKELEELHLKVPDRYGAEDEVALAEQPGVSYVYDEARQTVDIAVADAGRLPQLYDLRGSANPLPNTQSGTGAVLNYLLFGGGGRTSSVTNWQFQGASATLDARVYSPYGILSQSGILASDTGGGVISQRLRLDSTWTYKDPERILTYRAGDMISSGLAWTRPVRLGGFQVQRDFAIRPDLVTLPLPSFSGSAAVPSTVDVYVNDVRTISQDVDSGPFRLTNLPILSGQGDASVVVRDSSGRDVETTLPFLVSNQLLRGGLVDFSVEAGFPRLFYGALSNVYEDKFAGSGSLRYGFSDRLTLEAHAEGTTDLANGGIGASLGIDRAGVLSAAFAGSTHGGSSGGQVYASFDTTLFGVSLSASTLRTLGGYDDLASVTARPFGVSPVTALPPTAFAPGLSLQNPLSALRPPKIQDEFSIGVPLPLVGGAINFGYVHEEDPFGNRVKLLDAGYSRQVFNGASFFATAYAGLDRPRNAGISLGISIPFGDGVTASSGANRDRSGLTVASEVTKPLGQEPGSFGWLVSDLEGEQRLRSASAAYRGDYGVVAATAIQSQPGFAGTISQEGAIVAAGGDVFFANRIDDAFAVVDAGAPGLEVSYENRPVARTDASGKAIVPTLNAYQPNKISIDPRDLPLNASIATTQEILAPPDRSGVVADFGIRTDVRSAIVILDGANGQPLQAGLRGKTAGGRGFVVGYDGRAFIEGLKANNTAIVELASGECRAEFAYAPQGDSQVSIGPVVCQ